MQSPGLVLLAWRRSSNEFSGGGASIAGEANSGAFLFHSPSAGPGPTVHSPLVRSASRQFLQVQPVWRVASSQCSVLHGSPCPSAASVPPSNSCIAFVRPWVSQWLAGSFALSASSLIGHLHAAFPPRPAGPFPGSLLPPRQAHMTLATSSVWVAARARAKTGYATHRRKSRRNIW